MPRGFNSITSPGSVTLGQWPDFERHIINSFHPPSEADRLPPHQRFDLVPPLKKAVVRTAKVKQSSNLPPKKATTKPKAPTTTRKGKGRAIELESDTESEDGMKGRPTPPGSDSDADVDAFVPSPGREPRLDERHESRLNITLRSGAAAEISSAEAGPSGSSSNVLPPPKVLKRQTSPDFYILMPKAPKVVPARRSDASTAARAASSPAPDAPYVAVPEPPPAYQPPIRDSPTPEPGAGDPLVLECGRQHSDLKQNLNAAMVGLSVSWCACDAALPHADLPCSSRRFGTLLLKAFASGYMTR